MVIKNASNPCIPGNGQRAKDNAPPVIGQGNKMSGFSYANAYLSGTQILC